MLNDLLGWIVALGSLGLYLSRFFLPEVQRKNDAIWSGVGLFYALILWANGDRIKGGLLLGQMASVALIVWLGWQALQQRRQLAAPQDQTPLPESVQSSWPFVKTGLDRLVSTIKEGPSSIATQGSDSEKKEFKIGGLTLPLDLSALLTTIKGSPSQETAVIPKASPADVDVEVKDEDWGEEDVSQPSIPTEPVAEVMHEAQAPEVIEEIVEVVAIETATPEVAIASNELEQPVETLENEETSVQPDVSAEPSVAEAIPEPELVSDISPERTEEPTPEPIEADGNQPSSETDLPVAPAEDTMVETHSDTSEEEAINPPETLVGQERETSSELESEAVAHEEVAPSPAPEIDDGSWPPEDPAT